MCAGKIANGSDNDDDSDNDNLESTKIIFKSRRARNINVDEESFNSVIPLRVSIYPTASKPILRIFPPSRQIFE